MSFRTRIGGPRVGRAFLLLALLGACTTQKTEVSLPTPESVTWSGEQVRLMGTGFPAGARGALCFDGEWRPAKKASIRIDRCVDAWATSEEQATAAWTPEGRFEGDISVRFTGAVADAHARLSDVSFTTGANSGSPANSLAATVTTTPPFAIPGWSLILLFALLVTRTQAGHGLFVIGQVLGQPSSTPMRSLVQVALFCGALHLARNVIEPSWLILASLIAHPTLLDWVRGESAKIRSWRALFLWVVISAAATTLLLVPPPTPWPTPERLLLAIAGVSALAFSHAWVKRRGLLADLSLALGASVLANTLSSSVPWIDLLVGVLFASVVLRAAPLFHWSRPELRPIALGVFGAACFAAATSAPFELTSWSQLQCTAALLVCGTRIAFDLRARTRQLAAGGVLHPAVNTMPRL